MPVIEYYYINIGLIVKQYKLIPFLFHIAEQNFLRPNRCLLDQSERY